MIKGGGSKAARGIPLKEVEQRQRLGKRSNNNNGNGENDTKKKKKDLLKSEGLIQDVYETRFITYLARFVLVFDPAAAAWWKVCT